MAARGHLRATGWLWCPPQLPYVSPSPAGRRWGQLWNSASVISVLEGQGGPERHPQVGKLPALIALSEGLSVMSSPSGEASGSPAQGHVRLHGVCGVRLLHLVGRASSGCQPLLSCGSMAGGFDWQRGQLLLVSSAVCAPSGSPDWPAPMPQSA